MIKIEKTKFVTDVDGVLLCWFSGVKKYLQENNYPEDKIKMMENLVFTTNFINAEDIFGKGNVVDKINEFNSSEFIRMLPILQKEAIQVLNKISKSHQIIALTCLGTEEHQKIKRTENLINTYGKIFSDVICIGINESKEDYLRDLNKNNMVKAYIDDRYKHVVEAKNAGIEKSILFLRNRSQLSEVEKKYPISIDCWKKIDKLLNINNKNRIKLS